MQECRSTDQNVPAHIVTEVLCHLIPGLKQSYNYMCSETYYLTNRGIKFSSIKLRSTSAARYDIIFPLPYKHEWTLSYTYRVLICPIDESLEQQKQNITKHNNFPCCEQWFRRGEALLCFGEALACGVAYAAVNPRLNQPSIRPRLGVGLRRCVGLYAIA